jgi:hypothetical protein
MWGHTGPLQTAHQPATMPSLMLQCSNNKCHVLLLCADRNVQPQRQVSWRSTSSAQGNRGSSAGSTPSTQQIPLQQTLQLVGRHVSTVRQAGAGKQGTALWTGGSGVADAGGAALPAICSSFGWWQTPNDTGTSFSSSHITKLHSSLGRAPSAQQMAHNSTALPPPLAGTTGRSAHMLTPGRWRGADTPGATQQCCAQQRQWYVLRSHIRAQSSCSPSAAAAACQRAYSPLHPEKQLQALCAAAAEQHAAMHLCDAS